MSCGHSDWTTMRLACSFVSRISHYELERVLRGELAAIEWRLAMKIARFHRKTDILNLFPVKVGEYAELRVNEQPPSHPEGVLKKTGKKILHTMGFGTGVTGVCFSLLRQNLWLILQWS